MLRRDLLKILAGVAALPIASKFMKGKGALKPAAKTVAKTLPKVSGMPEWFTPLVNKIMKEGKDISPKVKNVEDIEIVKKLEIPTEGGKSETITLTQNKFTGEISIEANISGGVADSPFELNYRPPKSDVNLQTGKEIKEPGDFSVVEKRPRPTREPGDYEFDYDNFSIDEAFSDVEKLEKIATGKIKDAKKIAERAKGRNMVEESPYEDIMNRYPDPPDSDFYADGGIASFANGGKAKKTRDKAPAEKPLDRYKSYTEQEILENLESKYPNYSPPQYDIYETMPIYPPKDVVPKESRPVMPYIERTILPRFQQELAYGGLTKTIPPVKGPNPQGVESLFKKRYK